MKTNPRILIADDDASILFMMESILSSQGHEVIGVSNGHDAIRKARETHFDLCIIDLIMPGRDGIETMLEIRASQKKVPIIAMSGGWDGGTRSCLPLAAKIGANFTLAKPFDVETLVGAVRRGLQRVRPAAAHAPVSPSIPGLPAMPGLLT